VYGVEVSIYHHLAFTTEKPEKNAVEIYAKYHGSYPKALTAFVSDMENCGLALGDFVQRVNENNAPIKIQSEHFKPDFT
jgi:hypothetical protein